MQLPGQTSIVTSNAGQGRWGDAHAARRTQPGKTERFGQRVNPRQIFGHTFGIDATIAGIVFLLVVLGVLTAMALSRHRKRTGREPSERAKNTPLEVGYGLVVAAVVGFVVFLSFRATAQERPSPATGKAVVRVQAFRWCWRFSYPGHQRSSDPATCIGGDRPTMVVPAGVPITVQVTSHDVIHSWWVPYLRYKMDAFPHHVNTFTITIPRTGRWLGHCAEFCGENHFRMDFWLRAVSPQRYRAWLAHGGGTSA